ncbi:unnamed protein product [Parascedosporium putredinis]|uniref:Cation-transporting P-type ATPase C-terminal domain-containing protein n=1 Tax=Parascedosporium putredinis TaxID=1442378 RepID=A0A9P1H039_9PEZI|nr:unnamed protein product [Parascedosporium putredinis]CAI7992397.1 unnamed protein product [Parascedosporium putredinis]
MRSESSMRAEGEGDGESSKEVTSPPDRLGRALLVEGPSMADLTDEDWDIICAYEEIVFARTTPEQKLRIVTELRTRHNVVAVTGDGVNDAPALRAADVGVAVVTGSDVAIDAADLVLLDKFDSIVDAIRLGRLVFQNLQSAFLMIIICVFTDLFLSLSLIMEREEFNLMSQPPRDHRRNHLINLKIYAQAYLFVGFMETITAHSMFFLYMYKYAGMPISELFFLFENYKEGYRGYTLAELNHFNATGQCVYFVTLVFLQLGNVLAMRNRRVSIVEADPFRRKRRNPWLILSMCTSIAIAVFVTEVPGIQNLLAPHRFLPTSDVDVMMVLSNEAHARRLASGTPMTVYDPSLATYEGGYVDGNEPARYAFEGVQVLYGGAEGLEDALKAAATYPVSQKLDKIQTFRAQFEAWKWFTTEAIKKKNRYLLMVAVTKLVLFGTRLVLAHNEALYPYHKWMFKVLEGVKNKPEGMVKAAERVCEDPSEEHIQTFYDLVKNFREWEESPRGWPTTFLEDVELTWQRGFTCVDDV